MNDRLLKRLEEVAEHMDQGHAVYAPDVLREAIQRISELETCLHWYVEHDDTNEGDDPIPEYNGECWNQINEDWLKGLNRARAVLGISKNDS